MIDYIHYLEKYFKHYKINGDKFVACSPFRDEAKPSFAVNLETGVWIDSGASDPSKTKGDFYRLISLLSGIDYWEVRDLMDDEFVYDVSDLKLDLSLALKRSTAYLPCPDFNKSKYLLRRGIPIEVQRLFNVSQTGNVLTLPIFDKYNNCVSLKKRLCNSKRFWYEGNANPRDFLYGQNLVTSHCVWVVEGEIDAMTLWNNGKQAVATFGASITDKQLTSLKKYDKIVLAVDNDEVGKKFGKKLAKMLLPYSDVYTLDMPNKYKDVNELPTEIQKNLTVTKVKPNFIKE